MKLQFLTLALLAGLVSCDSSSETFEAKTGEVTSSISSGSLSDEELKENLKEIEAEEKLRQEEIAATTTTLVFDKLSHDYGDVLPNTDNETVFTVTNTGERPLIIEDVSASCGCTTPEKPEEPILPGQSDVIRVVFHPKPGQINEIKKTVTVTANTVEKIHMLEIRAFVRE
ncbi:MAG: DUF1573 domain-containing protein [Fluviicola sp.]|nr:DUF1573 domain-containing protein [Fluviicola sp.]